MLNSIQAPPKNKDKNQALWHFYKHLNIECEGVSRIIVSHIF